MTDALWNYDEPICGLGLDVPPWIDQDITGTDVAAIVQGGCASGAYMPAVTYYRALATMNEHGDRVLEFIEEALGELHPASDATSHTWAGFACLYLSTAVELWANSIQDEATSAIDVRIEG